MSVDPWEQTDGPAILLGDYKMTIDGYDTGEAKTGNRYVEFTLKSGNDVAKVKFYMSEAAQWRFARFCRAAGSTKAEFGGFDFSNLGADRSLDFLDTLIKKTVNVRFDWDSKPGFDGDFRSNYQDCWGADVKPKDPAPFVARPKPPSVAPQAKAAASGGGAKRPDIAGAPRGQVQAAPGSAEDDRLPF